mmetsp:Transcript_61063/g.176912  ORF Transcript_61063/g.176912 Transcript_61063/m.176912 type:complete len:268 (+) Transcript_61063:947-1750(+)
MESRRWTVNMLGAGRPSSRSRAAATNSWKRLRSSLAKIHCARDSPCNDRGDVFMSMPANLAGWSLKVRFESRSTTASHIMFNNAKTADSWQRPSLASTSRVMLAFMRDSHKYKRASFQKSTLNSSWAKSSVDKPESRGTFAPWPAMRQAEKRMLENKFTLTRKKIALQQRVRINNRGRRSMRSSLVMVLSGEASKHNTPMMIQWNSGKVCWFKTCGKVTTRVDTIWRAACAMSHSGPWRGLVCKPSVTFKTSCMRRSRPTAQLIRNM